MSGIWGVIGYYFVIIFSAMTNVPQDYYDAAVVFLEKLVDMVEFLIPNYVQEGKTQLVIAVGCTGGKHRSVTLASALYEALGKNDNYGIRIEHRDIGKDAITKAR